MIDIVQAIFIALGVLFVGSGAFMWHGTGLIFRAEVMIDAGHVRAGWKIGIVGIVLTLAPLFFFMAMAITASILMR